MICDTCGGDTDRRHPLIMAREEGIWVCDRCFRLYKDLVKHYSKKDYTRQRIIHIMRGVINKQKTEGKW